MTNIQSEDGTFSEAKIEQLEEMTGKTREELFSEFEQSKQPNVPDGDLKSLKRDEKLKFIRENGREAYQRLVDERK